MLIRKGNFPIFKLFVPVLAAVLGCCTLPARAARATDAAAAMPGAVMRAPDLVAAEFYGWYLDALVADQDPLSDRFERFNLYVAKPLVDRLVERLRGGVPANDYFLQAAGYRGAWLHGEVRAVVVRRQARQAEVLVTLGAGTDAQQVLTLTMVPEFGAWKIRRVIRTAPGRPESSARRPII